MCHCYLIVVLFEVESWEGGAVLANAAQPWKHPPGRGSWGQQSKQRCPDFHLSGSFPRVLCKPVAVVVQATMDGWVDVLLKLVASIVLIKVAHLVLIGWLDVRQLIGGFFFRCFSCLDLFPSQIKDARYTKLPQILHPPMQAGVSAHRAKFCMNVCNG